MKRIFCSKIRSQFISMLMVFSIFLQTGFTTSIPTVASTTILDAASATFDDVSSDYWAFQYIEALYTGGITGGCNLSPLQYCPETTVTRSQMAVFLLRGIHGSAYTPPSVGTSTGFDDVPTNYWAAAWIQQLAFEEITGGCGNGNYCPEYTVTRDQMAVFLLRSKYGSSYSPPAVGAGTGFGDVPTNHWAAAWIKQLVAEGITSGCGSGNYCPDLPVSRAQMAVFLVKAFGLPLNTLTPIIPTTTEILPSTTTQYLSSVSNDGSIYTFSQTTPELSGLTAGKVIVGEASSVEPHGFLRKVVSVSNSGGQVIVQTQPAALEEAIQQGEISISQALIPSAVQPAEFVEGVQPIVSAASNKISIQLNNVVLYDDDGNANTTNDQVNANGSVSLEPVFNFKLKVQDYQLKELYFTMTANQTTQLRIASKVSVTAKAEKVLATYPMGPLFLTIGPLPVTVYPVLTVVAGIDGTISTSVSTGVTQKLTETAGLSYANNSWKPIQHYSNQFTYDAPALSTGLSIKGYTGAKLKILLYGSVGPDIALNAYLKLEANPLQTPWWKLYGGLEMPVGISIDIFSHVVAGYSAVVIDYRILLAQAPTGICNPGQTINDPANDVSAAHIDVISLSTTLNNETLQAVFSIREVPSQLTFNRIGVPQNALEYEWGVYVDVDNDPQTGSTKGLIQGAEYSLSAMHFVFTPNSPISEPISNGVQKNIWEFVPPSSWHNLGPASLTVNTLSDRLTLSGNIPGITTASRLIFLTYDYNPGDTSQYDQSSCSTSATIPSHSKTDIDQEVGGIVQNWSQKP